MNRMELISLTQAIAGILRAFGEPTGADWLDVRTARLQSATSDEEVREIGSELHGIVLGMGGLTDLFLDDVDGRDGSAATTQLRSLADRLYQVTK